MIKLTIYNIIIILLMIVPIVISFSIILFYDRKKKEPLKKLLLGMLFGIILMTLLIILYKIIMYFNIYPNIDFVKITINIISIIIIGLLIEFVKFMLFYILITKNKYFDELIDSVVYILSIIFPFVIILLLLYMLFVKENAINFISLFTIVPTQIFTSIMMGYYMSMAVFTKSIEYKKKQLMKALFATSIINCSMYILLVNQYYLYAYATNIYYLFIILTFAIEFISALISMKYLETIYKLDMIYEKEEDYPKKYYHLMKKEEFHVLGKKNIFLWDKNFKNNILGIIGSIILLLIISLVIMFNFSDDYLKKDLNSKVVNIGIDVVPKVQSSFSQAKQITCNKYVQGGSVITKLNYLSSDSQKEIDKYMIFLLKNGYNFTSKIVDYNKTKTYELISLSKEVDKIILIDINFNDSGYIITIEKKNGQIIK